MALLTGRGRDRLYRADGSVETTPWRANLVTRSGVDLLASLLIDDSDRGISWLAVGRGDSAWDTSPPALEPGRVGLVDELARVSLRPGSIQLSFDAVRSVVRIRARFGAGVATGELRELAVFGGAGSARANSGTMVNHLTHPLIEKGDEDTLLRDLELDFSGGLDPQVISAVGGRLANAPSAGALIGVAVGTGAPDGTAPLGELVAEQFRRALLPGEARYEHDRATVVVDAAFSAADLHSRWPTGDDGRAMPVTEVALVIGDKLLDGATAVRQVVESTHLDDAIPVIHRFELSLGSELDVQVPELVGRPLAEAQSILGAGLVVGAVTEIDRPGVTATQIVAQDPPSGTSTPELSAVSVTIARRRTVLVPAVLGLGLERATAALGARSLVAGDPVGVPVSVDQVGTVVATEPAPGTVIDREGTVVLYLGEAIQIEMPNLAGLGLDAAKRALMARGHAGDVRVNAVARPWGFGTVVNQLPEPGTVVGLDQPVLLGEAVPILIEVPRLVELSLDEATEAIGVAARRAIIEHELQPGPVALSIGSVRTVPSALDPSQVLEQVPAQGERIQLYGTVDVAIAVGEKIQVPDLTGLTEDASVGVLGARGLMLGPVRQRSVLTEPGLVVDQDPRAATVLREGQSVSVTVSATPQVIVPNLTGLGLDGVVESLSARALRLGSDDVVDADGVPGTVASQVPSAGIKVDADSTVSIRLIAGVPDVVGMHIAEAARALAAAGLEPVVEEVPGGGVPGTVLAQDPRGGAAVPSTRRIALRVAAALVIEVPDLIGVTPGIAANRAEELGLRFQVAGSVRSDEPTPVGSVVRQDPVGGTNVSPGDLVRAWLRAEDLVEVPDVRGGSPDEASIKLIGLDLVPKIGDEVRLPGQPGTVGAMDPSPGVRVPSGTTIVLSPIAKHDVVVPDLRGASADGAALALERLGIPFEMVDSFAGVDAARRLDRHVISTKPGPGPIDHGVTVEVLVGILLPDLIGGDAQSTAQALKQLRLEVSIVDRLGRPASAGKIQRTAPPAGTPVAKDSAVVLMVDGNVIGDVTGPPIGVVRPPIGLPPIDGPILGGPFFG